MRLTWCRCVEAAVVNVTLGVGPRLGKPLYNFFGPQNNPNQHTVTFNPTSPSSKLTIPRPLSVLRRFMSDQGLIGPYDKLIPG
jgi:hypothetical protein